MINEEKIVDGLLKIISDYQKVKRSSVAAERLGWLGQAAIDDERIRETLLEHVGILPVIAAYLYQSVPSLGDINWEHSLAMLSVHDIGETVVGDTPVSMKTKMNEDEEAEAVYKILDGRMIGLFKEFDEQKTMEAKFARSVDWIAPFVSDMLLEPEVVKIRWKRWGFEIGRLREMTKKYYEWHEDIFRIYQEFVGRYEKIVRDEAPRPDGRGGDPMEQKIS